MREDQNDRMREVGERNDRREAAIVPPLTPEVAAAELAAGRPPIDMKFVHPYLDASLKCQLAAPAHMFFVYARLLESRSRKPLATVPLMKDPYVCLPVCLSWCGVCVSANSLFVFC